MPPPLHKPPTITHNVHADLKATFCYETATTKRIALIPHPHKFVSAIGAFTTHALNAGGPAAITCFMAGIDLTIADDVIFTHLANVPPLAGFLDSLLDVADCSLTQSNHAFKGWCILGDSISKIFKDWEAAWEKEREKERLKERELECCTAQASTEKPSRLSQGSVSNVEMLSVLPFFKKCKAHNTTCPQAALGDLPVLKKLKIGSSLASYLAGSQDSPELLLDIKHFLEGQGLLKELDIEELFAALDQACLLETLHLDIAFQTAQALLVYCECLCEFMDCNVAQTGTQLSALHFVNSNTSKSSKTSANDSNIDTPKAIPKDDDVSSAIAATLQLN
ncbi:hypothetical protein H0H87_011448 [Tephrocybe sp. NHM501043]|nr:hypothetical protein H0H87_011448 [Tephrocybe sp. NHM501043]